MRKYDAKEVMNLSSSSQPLPEGVRIKQVGNIPIAGDMVIDSDRDSLEGIDKSARMAMKSLTNKRSY